MSTRFVRLLPAVLLVGAVLAAPAPAAAAHRSGHHCTPDTRGALGERWPLRGGHQGRDIRILQHFLNRLGDDLNLDGKFGPRTRAAVDGWKGAVGRRQDGRMTCADIRVLREAIDGVPAEGGRDQGPVPGDLAEGEQARITPEGFAVAPSGAPEVVKRIIAAGNEIAHKPYRYGGGHGGRWEDSGYDCSGSVSYALYKAGLVTASMPSGGYMNWGEAGEGQWVTVYAHEGHMYLVVAGLRFDTSGRAENGSRWQQEMRDPAAYQVRHPPGL
ncbi:MAG TPA: peptidoglycan-binding domain-containing protein [Solirubrobacteraceae bacterium]|nr:peptidoglycan-binding domain-containing protein [Solirubrobacteraceae bacterium]